MEESPHLIFIEENAEVEHIGPMGRYALSLSHILSFMYSILHPRLWRKAYFTISHRKTWRTGHWHSWMLHFLIAPTSCKKLRDSKNPLIFMLKYLTHISIYIYSNISLKVSSLRVMYTKLIGSQTQSKPISYLTVMNTFYDISQI